MRRRGHTFLEFMLLLGGIFAAVIGMRIYIQRAMEGRLRYYSEQIGAEKYYAPGATLANFTQRSDIREASNTTSDIAASEAQIAIAAKEKLRLFSYGAEPER
jgi:hypothetical protein